MPIVVGLFAFFAMGLAGLSAIVGAVIAGASALATFGLSPTISAIFDEEVRSWEWFRNTIINPLLDEVDAAAQGDLPQESSQYTSEWESIPESERDLVSQYDSELKENLDKYQESLSSLTDLKQRKSSLASHFITDLPESNVERRTFAGDITRSGGVMSERALPENRGVDVSIDDWLPTMWSAFEEADGPDELEREIRSEYQNSHFDTGTIDYWEQNCNWVDWNSDLWSLYERDHLPNYKDTLDQEDDLLSNIETLAGKIEETFRDANKRTFLQSEKLAQLIWKIKVGT